MDKLIADTKKLDAVFAQSTDCNRVLFCFACKDDFAMDLQRIFFEYLIESYLGNTKKEYIKKSIKVKTEYYDILIGILTSFDRESEEKILRKILTVGENFSYDGYFYFRLQQLQDRWSEICTLAKENAFFFSNTDTLLELIRFLMSTIKPKIEKVVVTKGAQSTFAITNNDDTLIASSDDPDELLLHLIDIAPLEINLVGDILPKEQTKLLSNIFEEKFSNNTIELFKS
ncbi:MAG: hypothetical protein FWD76_05070 [Firmicutes bacterium]|nr:hypothetical protein [Bacillota bacterium]